MAIDPILINTIAPVAVVGVIGWVVTTWLRVKNGYPLENSWGKPMLPTNTNEALERVKLLSQENARLTAEIGSVKDRLQVLERIATDNNRAATLDEEIERLRDRSQI